MLKIGDFSKLSRVSVQALRHYDEMNLLKPAQVDTFTGYRYYSASQLPRFNRILALKDLGFSGPVGRQVVLTGGGAELKGMADYMQGALGRSVRIGRPRGLCIVIVGGLLAVRVRSWPHQPFIPLHDRLPDGVVENRACNRV